MSTIDSLPSLTQMSKKQKKEERRSRINKIVLNPKDSKYQRFARTNMDFLFAPLPETNFQMNTEELRLWQRNAIFECECDNFINRRIEAGQMHQIAPQHRPLFELYGIDAAIQHHGLRLPDAHGNFEQRYSIDISNQRIDDENRTDDTVNIAPPLRQRRRIMATNAADQDRDNMLDRLYQEALFTAFRTRGLNAIRNP